MSISVNEIRKDFPLLENQKVIYLDTAATSQKPVCVLEAEREFYEKYNANPLRGLYELGEAATEKYEEARETVREFLNAKEAITRISTRSAKMMKSFLALDPMESSMISPTDLPSCLIDANKDPKSCRPPKKIPPMIHHRNTGTHPKMEA